jgi:glycosyltransferase involved in cell wall biosynthesis
MGLKIGFARSGPLNMTPAVERYATFLRKAGFDGELFGIEISFHSRRPPVDFVDHLESLSASYKNTFERIWMMLRWQFFQLRHLWRQKPDVVQFCDVFSAVPALLIKWTRGAKLVYDVRDPARMSLSHWGPLSNAAGWLESFVARRSEVVVMVSEPLRALLDSRTQEKTVVVPNAPSEDAFKDFHFSSDGKLRVSLAGFVSHRRNLQAWCELTQAEPDVLLDVYGAVYDATTQQILDRFGIPTPKVIQNREAVERMATADAVSMMYDPAIEVNRYAAPNKFYEALMLGKPLICGEGMLIADEVRRVGCGVVVPYGDQQALSRAVDVLRDAQTRRRMGEAARRQFVEVYLGMPVRSRSQIYRRVGLL